MIEEKNTTTFVDGNPVPGLGLAQKCIGSNDQKEEHVSC
jgi:hypothetical protein